MSLATLLLVEDDFLTRAALTELLIAHQYGVDLASDGTTAIAMAQATTYDLILLDLQLPKLDGIGVCQQLRSQHYSNPILLLTARTANADIVAGLDAGADDYVTKPYEPEALLARIRALLRRQAAALSAGRATPDEAVVRWGDLCLDLDAGRVTFVDQAIALTATEFNLLELFLRNPDRIFSRDVILDRLWGIDNAPTERAIVTHVKDVRKKLKAGGLTEDIIETVYGMGYRLKPPPKTRSVLPEKSPEKSPEQSLETSPPSSSGRLPQHDAVQRVIERFRDSFNAQVDVLAQASAAIAAQQIDQTLYDAAKQEAHKLAGSMTTFGYPNGSRLARSIEHLLLEAPPTSAEQISRLAELVAALQQELHYSQLSASTTQGVAPASTPRSRLVLLIDNDNSLIAPLKAELETLGIDLAIAPDLDAAQSQLSATLPDAVVLDLGLSGCEHDGMKLLQDLSQRSPTLPVIVLTQGDNLTTRLVASRLGVRQFLLKPAPVEQMVRAIARVLPVSQKPTAKVLIVDDDTASLAHLSALLAPWGVEVATLDQPQRFWQVLTATRPHLIILDLEMPQISGLDLCQVVRQDAQWGDLPLLVVTAHNDTDSLQQAFAAGADDFISKPVIGPELITRVLSRIERTLDRTRSHSPALANAGSNPTANCSDWPRSRPQRPKL